CCVSVDLVREVGQGGATGEANLLTVAARQLNAAHDLRCLHCLVLIALLTLRLTAAARWTARTAECTCGAAATSAATATWSRTTWATRTTRAAWATTTATTAAETGSRLGGHLTRARGGWHHRRGWTTATALACCPRLRGALATARASSRAWRLSAAGTATGAAWARHVARGGSTTRARRALGCRGERVISTPLRARAWLRTRLRARLARCASWLLARLCCSLPRLRRGLPRLRRGLSRARGRLRCRGRLSRCGRAWLSARLRCRLRPSRRLGAWLRTTLGAVRHTASLCQRGRRRRRLGLLRDAVELLHLLDDRGLHGGGGCLNEFSLFLQGCKEFLAGHT